MLLKHYSQAVHNCASFSTLPLPLVHLSQQVEESLLGVWNVAICRPAQKLELAHHQLALLELQIQEKAHNTHIWHHCSLLLNICMHVANKLFWVFLYILCGSQLEATFECSPGCVLAFGAVLTQQPDFEIYGSVGVRGARAVSERGPCVFITLSCRISPNT